MTEIKTVPYVPLSHPFVERLIGTVRRELLDRTRFWTTSDLETKLADFQHYYNAYRTHAAPWEAVYRNQMRSVLYPYIAAPIGGKAIAEGCTRLPSRLDYEFAIHSFSPNGA